MGVGFEDILGRVLECLENPFVQKVLGEYKFRTFFTFRDAYEITKARGAMVHLFITAHEFIMKISILTFNSD